MKNVVHLQQISPIVMSIVFSLNSTKAFWCREVPAFLCIDWNKKMRVFLTR